MWFFVIGFIVIVIMWINLLNGKYNNEENNISDKDTIEPPRPLPDLRPVVLTCGNFKKIPTKKELDVEYDKWLQEDFGFLFAD